MELPTLNIAQIDKIFTRKHWLMTGEDSGVGVR